MDISRLLRLIHVLGLLRRLQNHDRDAYSAIAAVRAGGAAFDGDSATANAGAAADAAILHDHQIVVVGREWICPVEADSGRNLCAACNRDNHNIYRPRLSLRKHIQFAGKQYGIRKCERLGTSAGRSCDRLNLHSQWQMCYERHTACVR